MEIDFNRFSSMIIGSDESAMIIDDFGKFSKLICRYGHGHGHGIVQTLSYSLAIVQ